MKRTHGCALIAAASVLCSAGPVGCMARSAPPGPGLGAASTAPPTGPMASPAAPVSAPAMAPVVPPVAPAGYVPMHASEVVPTREGEAVLLLDEKETVAVPIFIGGSEATSIRIRLAKRRYERPLTHDLLDAVMHEAGARLVRVQVDDLKANTYLGAIFVELGGRVLELDARPSDAIALAIGNHAPIFVACRVIAEAAISRTSLEDREPPAPTPQVEGCPPKPTTTPTLRGTGI